MLDDFGLEKLGLVSRMALLEIIEDRHKRKPIIIVPQIHVSTWHDIIDEPTIADAIPDRLFYNSS
nr:ATP-binding protein [Spirochaeta cellobiosiphila]